MNRVDHDQSAPARQVGPALALIVIALQACGVARAEPRQPVTHRSLRATPQRPAACTSVPVGNSIQAAIDAADAGDAICLSPGTYAGPLRIGRAVTLWGPHDAIVRSNGVGTTILVTAPSTRLLGFSVEGSGDRYDTDDAGIHVSADDARIEGVRIAHAVYGILVMRAQRAVLRGNEIIGTGEPALGLRGDAIRLWESQHCEVTGNHVADARDLVVWYSEHNTVSDNVVERGRYGTHFMHSSDTLVLRNRYVSNVVGVFVMYSHRVSIRGNVLADASGGAGIGLGLKDSGNVTAVGNAFVGDTVGLYLDGSPSDRNEHNRFERNVFRLGQTGVLFHASQERNSFIGNSFRDQRTHVGVEGGGDALGTEWDGNDFDDYAGYDMDGDGVGDVPYESQSLSESLAQQYPNLDFFRGAPVLALIDAVSHVAPLFAPQTLLIDRRPRIRPLSIEALHAD